MAPLIAAKTIHFFIIKAGEQPWDSRGRGGSAEHDHEHLLALLHARKVTPANDNIASDCSCCIPDCSQTGSQACSYACSMLSPWSPLAGVMQRLIEKHYSRPAGHRCGRVSSRDASRSVRCPAVVAVCVRVKHAIEKFIKNHFH